MKNLLLLSIFLLTGFSVTAQSTLELRGYFGVSGASASRKVDLDGASSVSVKKFKEIGLLLSKEIGTKFTVTGGVNYAFSKVDYDLNYPPCAYCDYIYIHTPDFKMLSIPVYAEYGLGKYLYAAAGPIVDFQLSEGNNFSDQSGIGYLVGLGAKMKTEKLSFSIFPNYKRHGVIPFDNSPNYKHVLQEVGVQFGVGYIL